MNSNEKRQLEKLIGENDVVDNTALIREVKHSDLIKKDIIKMNILHETCGDLRERNIVAFHEKTREECSFIFTHYTEIYHKLKNREIDHSLLMRFVGILKQIEDGNLDQHEASYSVGTVLKEIYIDSALKDAERLDSQTDNQTTKQTEPAKSISWKEYRRKNH
jgi:hypothetical protein|uniref:Uncharacterized protein n=1 Tax=viral metagenome TaxID=1070528 RepID=A0A6C0JCX2_9ZZZZ